jgi:GAF domain-containing protein
MTGDEPARTNAHEPRGSSGESIDAGVAQDLGELARELQAEPDTSGVMQRIVDAVVAEVDGACGAAITLLHKGQVSSPTHSDQRAATVGLAQKQTGEGPCVDTSREELTLRSDNLLEELRWPAWAAAAVRNGVLSVMSVQLFVDGDSMGALDVYGDHVGAFDAEAENTSLLLASHAAVALASSRQNDRLRSALDTRDVIGQAKGILMERHKLDAVRAFDLLVRTSQQSGRKLHDVADTLASTGELPDV